jgi:glycosyltransferase involved in cell wall biosynthesis
MASSRNLGLLHSTGDYVAQLDSDDVWCPTHLEDKVATLASNPQVAMVYGPMRIWNSWSTGNPARSDWIQQFTFHPERIIHPLELIPALLSGRDDPQGVIMRRKHVASVGGYEKATPFYADTTIHCKLAINYPTYISRNCTYWYRQHDNSYCGAVRATVADERIQFLQWFKSYLATEEIREPRVHSALHYEMWKAKHPRIERCLELPFRIKRSVTRQYIFTISEHR